MDVLDTGQWRVMHPDEIMVTFQLPLSDPLPLQDGAVFPTYRPMETATIQVLDPWLDQLWLQALDGSGCESCRLMRRPEGGTSSPVNWSNKFTLSSSIQIHQTFSDAGLRVGLEPAIQLATVTSGPPLSADDRADALDKLASTASDSADIRATGLGAVTVAECVLGLRIIGDVPDLEDALVQGVPGDPLGGWEWIFFVNPLGPSSPTASTRRTWTCGSGVCWELTHCQTRT